MQNATAATKSVVDAAIGGVIARKQAFVEPAHLVAALLEEPAGAALEWLRDDMRLDLDALKKDIAPMLAGPAAKTRPGQYSGATKEILDSMSKFVQGRDRQSVTTLDLLMSILRQEMDPVARRLKELGVRPWKVEHAIESQKYRDR